MSIAAERIKAHDFAQGVVNAVSSTMFGVDDVIRLCIVALTVKKHVLLEGNPGLGKTDLVKSLAETLGLETRRIQFTPDLLPSDITTTARLEGNTISLQPGPIFTSLLLADEINRATQKTQAALLEAMAEKQVTVNGVSTRLDEGGRPFMVMATQNPVDHEGTYELPEAQLDRFMFKILMPTPQRDTVLRILRKTTGEVLDEEASAAADGTASTSFNQEATTRRNQTIRQLTQHYNELREIRPIPAVQSHILNLFRISNRQGDAPHNRPASDLAGSLRYGLGPRAATDLMLAAKAWTLLFDAPNLHKNDSDVSVTTRALAKVALPVLRHRLKLSYSGLEDYAAKYKLSETASEEERIDRFAVDFLKASLPADAGGEYERNFNSAIDEVVRARAY